MRSGDGSGRRSTTEIEKEIESTRAELEHTLDALAHQLTPRHLLEEGIDMITGHLRGDSGVGTVSAAISANALPLTLIAAGIGWLVANNTIDRRKRVEPKSATEPDERDPGRISGPLPERMARHPLLVGIAGIVSGAVIAAVLPATKREQEWVDKARGELWKKVEEMGHEAADRVRSLAECSARTTPEPAVLSRPDDP